ncbi:MAG: hypothetical protein CTY15_14550 [Methylocystis sp.]|nr:MAG: hypothetical protein CTY15_14550 [Methylocystis sp.]
MVQAVALLDASLERLVDERPHLWTDLSAVSLQEARRIAGPDTLPAGLIGAPGGGFFGGLTFEHPP